MEARIFSNDSIIKVRESNLKQMEFKMNSKMLFTKYLTENENKIRSNNEEERRYYLNLISKTFDEESLSLISIIKDLILNNNKRLDSVSINRDIAIVKNNFNAIQKPKLSILYKPLNDCFTKGKQLYDNYRNSNFSYKYAKLIYLNNKIIMALLVKNIQLIPENLISDKQALMDHLSLWTSAFEKQERDAGKIDENETFRVKYSGRTFPDISAQKFKDEFLRLEAAINYQP